MSDADERAALAAGHALGSLSAQEEADYEAYLAASADHRQAAAGFDEVADALRADAPTVTPTPDLKQRLMAQIAVTSQVRAAERTALDDLAQADTHEAPATRRDLPESAARRARRRWFQHPLPLSLAAAVAAIVIFAGGLALGLGTGSTTAPPTAQADTLAQIAAAADAQRTTVPVAGGGEATLVWSDDLAKSAIVNNDIPAAPAGKTYQLWYIRDGSATSAGLMSADGGRTWTVLSGKLEAGDVVGITVEPTGGSEQPTTEPVAVITL